MSSSPSDWHRMSIDELCERVTSGGTPRRSEPANYENGTIPWVKTGELLDGYIGETEERITERALQTSSARLLPADTVLMAMYGATVGALGILAEPAACNQASCAMIADRDRCNPRWLFYALLNDRSRIVSLATGAAQQNLSGRTIREFEYLTPPLHEQDAIAEVLGALDDKIAANRELIQRADSLARLTFKRALVGSAKSVKPLSSFADFINGRAFTKNASGTGRVVIRIAELNSGLGGSTVYNDIDVADQHLARPGDILFAWSGSLTMHRWYRPEAIVNQHIFKVIPNEGNPPWLVWQLIAQKLEEFRAIAADKATTMGHIRRRDLDEPVMAPSETSIRDHHELMAGLWSRALAAEQESLTLAATRDALLPALMSGKLRVKDAERQAEAVV